MLCRHRKTMIKILKTIRCCTGSQWSEWRIGVMWEDLLVSVMSLAAEFWRRWRRWIWYSGRFMRTPFEKSRREEMSEWTRHSVVLRVRYLRMWDILRSWNLTLLQMVEMWWLKVISVSKVTPRSNDCCFVVKAPASAIMQHKQRHLGQNQFWHVLQIWLMCSHPWPKMNEQIKVDYTIMH